MGDGGWMWGHGWGSGGWLLMCVLMLVFWAGLIAAVVAAIRYLDDSGRSTVVGSRAIRAGTGRRPEDILAERYAAGEIDDEEFRRRLSLLREHRFAP